MTAGVVHQDTPHEVGCGTKKMVPILPAHAVLFDQPQIGFMHQGGGLQGVVTALAPEVGGS
jgi:hypothetical protein